MPKTVTSKGQVTIPKPFRDQLGIGPGSKVDFTHTADGVLIKKAEDTQQLSRFDRAVGILGPGLSTDELMELLRGGPE